MLSLRRGLQVMRQLNFDLTALRRCPGKPEERQPDGALGWRRQNLLLRQSMPTGMTDRRERAEANFFDADDNDVAPDKEQLPPAVMTASTHSTPSALRFEAHQSPLLSRISSLHR